MGTAGRKVSPGVQQNRCLRLIIFLRENFTVWASNCSSVEEVWNNFKNTGLFINPSGISELNCATTKTDKAERSISIGREPLQVFFVLGALAYFQVPPLGGSREEKWRSQ